MLHTTPRAYQPHCGRPPCPSPLQVSLPDGCTMTELLAVLSAKQQRGAASAAAVPSARMLPAGGMPSTVWSLGAGSMVASLASTLPSSQLAGQAAAALAEAARGVQKVGRLRAAAASVVLADWGLLHSKERPWLQRLPPWLQRLLPRQGSSTCSLPAPIMYRLQRCVLRYRLPSEPSLWVDLVDEEDVR